MRILVFMTVLFLGAGSSFASEPVHRVREDLPSNAIPFDRWPKDMLVMRENELREKIHIDDRAISRADSAEITFLLSQVKFNTRLSTYCTFFGKLIMGGTAGASGLITALNWPTYLIYISSAVGSGGLALTHYGEMCTRTANDLEKAVIARHSDDVVEYQKIHEVRKRVEQQEIAEAKAENSTVTQAVKTMYRHVMGIQPETPDEDLKLSDLEAGMRMAMVPEMMTAPVGFVAKDKEERDEHTPLIRRSPPIYRPSPSHAPSNTKPVTKAWFVKVLKKKKTIPSKKQSSGDVSDKDRPKPAPKTDE